MRRRQLSQVREETLGILISRCLVFPKHLFQESLQGGRNLSFKLFRRSGFTEQYARHGEGGALIFERVLSSQHLIQNDSETENVTGRTEWLTLNLLRRHVRHRADHMTRLTQEHRGGRLIIY